MSINARIQHLVNIKAAGKKNRFAEMVNWKPQYMGRITTDGGPVGLAVVERILNAFPDVNARWLILGEGRPLLPHNELNTTIHERISEYLQLAKYSPYMDPEELESFNRAVKSGEQIPLSKEQLYRWQKNRDNDGKQ